MHSERARAPARPWQRLLPVRKEVALTSIASPATASLPSLREIATIAFRKRWGLAFAILLPLLAALSLCFVLTPKYEAAGRILVRIGREYIPQNEPSNGGMQTTPSTSMKETVDTEIQILTSMDLIRDVLRTETAERLYPGIVADPPPDIDVEYAAAKAFAHDLTVRQAKQSNVIEVNLRNTDREVALHALGTLLARFQARHVAAFSQGRSVTIEAQIGTNLRDLAALERERAAYRTTHRLYVADEQRTLLVKQRADDVQALRQAEIRATALDAQVASLGAQLARMPETVTTSTQTQDSAVAGDARRRLRDLRERESELLSRRYAGSYDLDAVRGAIAAVQATLAQTPERSVTGTIGANPALPPLQVQLATSRAEREGLTGQIAALRAAVAADDDALRQLAQDEIGLQDLTHRIADLETTTTTLRQRLTDARYLEELDRARVASLTVIQQPVAFQHHVFPRKLYFLAAGLLLGCISAGFVLLLALSSRRFLAAETVERVLGVPVLASLPVLPASRANGIRQNGAVR